MKDYIYFNDEGLLVFPRSDNHALEPLDLVHVEVDGHRIFVWSKHRPRITTTGSLIRFEILLPNDPFMRIHNGHFINLSCVASNNLYGNRGRELIMRYSKSIALVSDRKAIEFMNRFKAFENSQIRNY